MPRYFFHVVDGQFLQDTEGIVWADGAQVTKAAVTIAGEMIRKQGETLWRTGRYDMFVVDEHNRTKLRLTFEAEDLTGELGGDPDRAIKGIG